MKLFNFFNSSASYRVRIALALKGIDYQTEPVNIRLGEQYDTEYLQFNPVGVVPTLIDDEGNSIGQSLAIIDYLEQCFPVPQLLPQGTQIRTQVLEIASIIACDIHPVNNMRVLRYLTDELQISDSQKKNWYAHWIKVGLDAVERLLEKNNSGNYCVGDQVTLADCFLIPQWANALRMECELSHYPRCQKVYQHCSALPEFIVAAPENQPGFIAP
ncbi:maleylacetoacetate isomerase [Xenorhabdus bovienii]|uniref:Maleylacetoacetate isomerase n=1 Tax=Xenorhabdus bovienii TaxID=40576 RepID=A0AAJ1J5W3_XENBV|nr:maleylacetoacetate isomerase [Xenorhabdus bovienii]MDE1477649.1 maleylacetoacetate isomerase [Xenorhabdus bovienii]MDE1490590.1 maleylacetoacetate isomerase [Xenorhabdus bovienii]MDE1493956.1 maleylacetoacetate isomerase [Xenorhabdus bovienii]MDE9471969.1 maleylacetoacetate isomerase [Xenorhabdus bovienii]MDE9509390.1 maleylacetoacetate isomerase [Xenorhabdus bovienii]